MAVAVVNGNVEASKRNFSKASRNLAGPVGQLALLTHTSFSVALAMAFSEPLLYFQHLVATREARDTASNYSGAVTDAAKLVEFYGHNFVRAAPHFWPKLEALEHSGQLVIQ